MNPPNPTGWRPRQAAPPRREISSPQGAPLAIGVISARGSHHLLSRALFQHHVLIIRR
jgi:hypothetical protein